MELNTSFLFLDGAPPQHFLTTQRILKQQVFQNCVVLTKQITGCGII